MSQAEGQLSSVKFHIPFVNITSNIFCNTSLYEMSNDSHTTPGTKTITNRETYLERSLGFLLIGGIGVVANSFVILILGSSSRIRQKLVNTLIIHQSFVDLLTSIVLIGMAHLDGLDKHGLEGLHADIYCFITTAKMPLWLMMDISSFSLVFLNIERYISIVHPIYHHTKVTRKKVLMLLPIVWFLGLVEQLFVSSSFESENGVCIFGTPEMFHYMAGTFIILHFFFPVMLVFFLYGHMILKLRKAVISGNNTTSSNRNDVMEKAKNNVFKTMLFITVCYAICYVFNSVYVTLVIIGTVKNLSGK